MTKLKSPSPTSLEMQIQLRVCCSSLPVHLHSKSCPRRFPSFARLLFSLFPLISFPYISLFRTTYFRLSILRSKTLCNLASNKYVTISSKDSEKNIK